MQNIRQTIFNSPTGDIEGANALLDSCPSAILNPLCINLDIEILATDAGAYG